MVWSGHKHARRLVSDDVKGVCARAAIVVCLAVAAGCGPRAEPESIYTSIRSADCKPPAKDVAAPYAARDLGVQQCPAPDGWRLLLVSSDANTWIDLAGPGVTWSGERPIAYDSPIGNFPSIGGSPTVEWRRDASGRLMSLIFRVSAQDPETLKTQRSRLFVIRLQHDGACVIGRAATNEEARKLADGGSGCGS